MIMHAYIFHPWRQRTGVGLNNLRRVMLAMLLLLLGSVAKPASAACTITGHSAPISAIASLTGSITIGRDVPIGTVLYRARYTSPESIGAACTTQGAIFQRAYFTTPLPVSGYSFRGQPVYTTSIPGIGAYVANYNDTWLMPAPPGAVLTGDPSTSIGSGWSSDFTGFQLNLIKISDTVGAGTISGADLPSVQFSIVMNTVNNSPMVVLNGQFSGQLNVVSRTCTTPDVSVDLGQHYTSELSGIGTTTKWVTTPIALNNCPAFFGRNQTTTDAVNGVSTSNLGPNVIQYAVSPTTPVVVPAQGVMALQPDGVNPTASNIGIQLGDASGTPVTYGTFVDSGLPLNQTDGSSYVIPLQARYYQTGATPVAGQANGAATITLSYQ